MRRTACLRLTGRSFQPCDRGSIQHVAVHFVEAGAVARAVPRLLARIPAHDAPQMSAYGRVLVQGASFVAVNGELPEASAHDGAGAGRKSVHRRDIAPREVI